MATINNDVIQYLNDRTAISSCRLQYSTYTSGAAFDASALWVDLGAIDAASPSFQFNKNITDVMTGSPMTTKQRHITSYEGTIGAELISYNNNGMNVSVGTEIGLSYTLAVDGQTTVAAGASTTSFLFLTAVTGLAIGDRIRVELGNTAFTWYEDKRIIAIDTTAKTVTLDGTLSEVPAVGADAQKIERVDTIVGGNKLRDYQMRMVCSFNDESTMVIHAPKGNFTAAVSPNMGDGTSIAKIPLQFGVLGVATTVAGFTAPQVTLATHYAYYPAS